MRVLLASLLAACSVVTTLDDLRGGDAGLSEAGPTFTCAGDAAFCDDFEQEQNGQFARWTSYFEDKPTSTVTWAFVDSGCAVVDTKMGTNTYAYLREDFPAGTKIHYAFDMLVSRFPTVGGSIETHMFELAHVPEAGIAFEHLYLSFAPGASSLMSQYRDLDGSATITFSNKTVQRPLQGVWTHYDLTIDLGSLTASLLIGGAPQPTTPLPAEVAFGAWTLQAGVASQSASSDGMSFDVDNVEVWLE